MANKKKKKAYPKKGESGIYKFLVDGNKVRRRIAALTKDAAIEQYKREFPADNEKNVTAEKVMDMPIYDAEGRCRALEEIERMEEEATQAHIDSFPKK